MQVDEKLKQALEKIGLNILSGNTLQGKKALSNEDAKLLYSLGFSLYHSAEYSEANKVFQKLVYANPLDKNHWIAFASSLQMDNKFENSLTAWTMAALIDVEDPLPHYYAGECLLSLKHYDQAIDALKCAKSRLNNRPNQEINKKVDALLSTWEMENDKN